MSGINNNSNIAMGNTASVIDGILQQNSNVEKTKTAAEMNALGKESFLQLLVCQMENQDPLQPTTDTEWVSQLATYSQLEQMQNMNLSLTNTQAFNLVGQEVILNTTTEQGETKSVSGAVDYVTVKGGKAYLSVEGNLYPMDDLVSVIDYEYLVKNCIPSVTASNVTYDKADPKDVSFQVNMGSDMGTATAVAVILNEEVIPANYVNLSENGIVTISAAAFAELETGSYTPTIVFNDNFNTTSTGDFLLYVTDTTGEETHFVTDVADAGSNTQVG